jgi:hypothetical protein
MNHLPQHLHVVAVEQKGKISLSVDVARRRHRNLPLTLRYYWILWNLPA